MVFGRVLLPLLLTILAAASGPDQRARLHGVRARVQDAARMAQQSFSHSAEHGAKKLEQASERHKERERRRAEKRKRKHERRHRRNEKFSA